LMSCRAACEYWKVSTPTGGKLSMGEAGGADDFGCLDSEDARRAVCIESRKAPAISQIDMNVVRESLRDDIMPE